MSDDSGAGVLLQDGLVQARTLAVTDHRFRSRRAERVLGAYYTDPSPAEAMAGWILRTPTDRVLEPCFGDGAFLRAVNDVARARGYSRLELSGAELVGEVFAKVAAERLLATGTAHRGDFLAMRPFEVDAVIGNPPYVRLRHLTQEQQRRAMRSAERVLGGPMDTSGSLWMPFVLHATRFLTSGGRLAFVLPYDFTYVRYARSLWQHLAASFGELRVVRVRERLFPDILQDVVLFFADGYGGATNVVNFETVERRNQLRSLGQRPTEEVEVRRVVAGEKAFIRALLPQRTRGVLDAIEVRDTVAVSEVCTFNIGYVAGDKDYFHPSARAAKEFGIPPRSLRRAVTSSRQLAACGLRTATAPVHFDSLFLPKTKPAKLSAGELAYINHGVDLGIDGRYKCRVRDPWYIVPGVKTPDLLLSVFAEQPVLTINDRGLAASNSVLCGYLTNLRPERFAAAWYTSLTVLQCELEVHALGGGVFVLVPGEAGRLRIVNPRKVVSRHLGRIGKLLSDGDVAGAYRAGDNALLVQRLGLGAQDVEAIYDGIDVLRSWRTRPKEAAPPLFN